MRGKEEKIYKKYIVPELKDDFSEREGTILTIQEEEEEEKIHVKGARHVTI